MKIRRAKPEDAEEIWKLRTETFEKINGKDNTKEQVKAFNAKNTLQKIIEKMKKREMFCLEDKIILGVVDLEGDRIGGLFVRYNYVKNGFGKRLLEFIEDYARKKGIKKVRLSSTKTAEGFYLKFGYNPIKKINWEINGVKFENLEMEKKL
jgi:N-acetylglutamate synthase-like GNAT family acetyltransferase